MKIRLDVSYITGGFYAWGGLGFFKLFILDFRSQLGSRDTMWNSCISWKESPSDFDGLNHPITSKPSNGGFLVSSGSKVCLLFSFTNSPKHFRKLRCLKVFGSFGRKFSWLFVISFANETEIKEDFWWFVPSNWISSHLTWAPTPQVP